jgi:hypothetical protein
MVQSHVLAKVVVSPKVCWDQILAGGCHRQIQGPIVPLRLHRRRSIRQIANYDDTLLRCRSLSRVNEILYRDQS